MEVAIAAGGVAPKKEAETVSAPEAPPRGERRMELSRVRRTTAKRMSESKREVPHFYASSDIRMDEAVRLKATLADLGGEFEGITFTHLVLKAVGIALEIGKTVIELLIFERERIGDIQRTHFAGGNVVLIGNHAHAGRDVRGPLIARDVRDLKERMESHGQRHALRRHAQGVGVLLLAGLRGVEAVAVDYDDAAWAVARFGDALLEALA